MKRISFFIMSNTGSRARQISFPGVVLSLMALFAVLVLGVTGYFIYDYHKLKSVDLTNQLLSEQIRAQKGIIANQNTQIQTFASEINKLKSKIVTLNNFEEKIRVIANLDQSKNQEGLFGVGGSIPEDLSTDIDLLRRQTSLMREMHQQVDQLQVAATGQKSGFSTLLDALEGQKNLLACTPAIKPTKGYLTSRFGYRKSPFTGRREMHKGLDIANREGTQVIAPADGTVKFVGRRGLMGKTLIIDHGHGMVTRYGHLSEYSKKRGEPVKRGEVIAQMGNTGRSTGPHLHYEVLLNGVPVNPIKYIIN
jgi:murein DD-endopeptidase MepM/ murein hydrolase activator NlpD